MNDFLKQLRSGGAKRFDKTRRSYDNPQYRGMDRQNGRDRKNTPHRKNYDHVHLQGIKKVLETIVDGQKMLVDFSERQVAATERIAVALEKLAAQLPMSPGQPTDAAEHIADGEMLVEMATDSTVPESLPDVREDSLEARRTKVIRLIRDQRGKGTSFDEIAQFLIAEQVPTLTGKGQWRAQAVSRLYNQGTRSNG